MGLLWMGEKNVSYNRINTNHCNRESLKCGLSISFAPLDSEAFIPGACAELWVIFVFSKIIQR